MVTQIAAISGSLRKGSFNTLILKKSQLLAQKFAQINILDIAKIPLYNGDLEETSGIPSAVSELKEAINQSDGLLICTPEYNRSMPGVLKNAIDWATRPTEDIPEVFGNKPTAIIGSAASFEGSAYSQTAWLPVIKYLNVNPYFEKGFSLGASYDAFDDQENFKDSAVEKRLLQFLEGFNKFIQSS